MIQNDDPNRVRNSLYLCVRSVRHMTEQLVTIVSSLSDVAGDCGSISLKNKTGTNHRQINRCMCDYRYTYDDCCSENSTFSQNDVNSSEFSSNCAFCDCVNQYCGDKMCCKPICHPVCVNIPRKQFSGTKKIEEITQKDEISKQKDGTNEKNSEKRFSAVNPSHIDMISQTDPKKTEDKKIYTTPEQATQTNKEPTLELRNSKNETIKTLNSPEKGNKISNSQVKFQNPSMIDHQDWNSLIRSQIEEVLSKKISEKMIDSKKESNKSLEKRKSSQEMKIKQESVVLENIASQTDGKNGHRLKNEGENLKESLNEKSQKENNKIKNEQNSLSSKNHKIENLPQIVVNPGDSLRDQPDLPNSDNSGNLENISSYKMEIEAPSGTNGNSKNELITDPVTSDTFLSNKKKENLGNHNSTLKDVKKDVNINFQINSDKISIFDEFDYVSEVEFISLCSSEKEPLKISDSIPEISVYDSFATKIDRELPKYKILYPKKSDDTILSNDISSTSSQLSAFSERVSKEYISSNSIQFSKEFSGKSYSNEILYESQAARYINNMKSINTLSSSTKEKNVRYKSISVTNLDRNFSNKSQENTVSKSSFYHFSNSDVSSASLISNSSGSSKKTLRNTLNKEEMNVRNCGQKKKANVKCKTKINGNNLQVDNFLEKSRITKDYQKFQVYNEESKDNLEYFNKNRHNSNGSKLDEEIFIEQVEEHDNTFSVKEKYSECYENINIVDISVPTKRASDSESSFSDNLHSLYCEVIQNNDEDSSSKENIVDQQDPTLQNSQSETIFLQAILEVHNGNLGKGDSKLYKIHLDKNHFSIEDNSSVVQKSLNNSEELDTIISCFDTICKGRGRIEKKKRKKGLKRVKIENKSNGHNKNRLNDFTNCSLVECYLDDFIDFNS